MEQGVGFCLGALYIPPSPVCIPLSCRGVLCDHGWPCPLWPPTGLSLPHIRSCCLLFPSSEGPASLDGLGRGLLRFATVACPGSCSQGFLMESTACWYAGQAHPLQPNASPSSWGKGGVERQELAEITEQESPSPGSARWPWLPGWLGTLGSGPWECDCCYLPVRPPACAPAGPWGRPEQLEPGPAFFPPYPGGPPPATARSTATPDPTLSALKPPWKSLSVCSI